MVSKIKTALVTAAAVSTLALSMPAFGQDEAASEGDSDVDTPTLLAYLGLTAASGQNTIGEGAGGIEGHMLAAAMAMKAAKIVAGDSEVKGRVILLNGSETLNLGEAYQARRLLDLLEVDADRFAVQVRSTGCIPPGTPVAPGAFFSNTKSVMAIPPSKEPKKFNFQPSDVLGAIRTSSSFSPVSVTLGPQLFKNAMLAQKKDGVTWIVPGDVNQPTGGDTLIERFYGLRATLAPYADGKCDNIDEAIKKAATALLTKVDGLAASKEGAPSLLDKAALAESILEGGSDLKVLRVDVDRAGGTVVNTSNIFTSVGVPGITVRGGMVVTYRLTTPTNGQMLSSGIVSCRVPKKLLKSITSKAIDAEEAICEKVT